ncbi:sulfatase [Shivajiella indica]|uniref:Sulfatase n=1 Tax=Shivajiella indica TaxID=872115 RepID=A0ABW5BAX4_9BACT
MRELVFVFLALVFMNKGYAQNPNIIFILTDDLGYTDLGCYGNPYNETPNLDSLAKGGLLFTDAYSSSPVCSPSRAGLMTGKHPARIGLTNFLIGNRTDEESPILPPDWQKFLPANELTLPEILKSRNYYTGMIGKWHLGNGEGQSPWDQGFDFSRSIGKNGLDYYNYSIFEDSYEKEFEDNGTYYLTDRLTDYAIEFLENKKEEEQPFFLFLSYSAPHVWLVPRGDKLSKYLKKYNRFNDKYNPYYAAMIESVDDGVGNIIKKLQEMGILENTLIIFTSDNGGVGLAEQGPIPTDLQPLKKWKGHNYEGGIRVPLIAFWKGRISEERVSDLPTSNIDFFPSIAALVGVPVQHQLDGKNILNHILDGAEEERERPLFWHYPHFSNQLGRPSAAVRLGNWKLILRYEDQGVELYNLQEDIGENNDLSSKEIEIKQRLFSLLLDWLKETNARLPLDKQTLEPIKIKRDLM